MSEQNPDRNYPTNTTPTYHTNKYSIVNTNTNENNENTNTNENNENTNTNENTNENTNTNENISENTNENIIKK
jgi:hypothetical protein